MSVGKRLKEFRIMKKITQEGLASLLKIATKNISDYETGKTAPSLQSLQTIRNTYNLSLDWLLTGEGSMFLTDEKPLNNKIDVLHTQNQKTLNDNYWYIRVNADISAGNPLQAMEHEPLYVIPILKSLIDNPDNYYCFRVNGDSMSPEIEHNDYVVMAKKHDFNNIDNKIVAMRNEDGLNLKRLVVATDNKSAILVSVNTKYNPIVVSKDHIIVGVLKLVIRRY